MMTAMNQARLELLPKELLGDIIQRLQPTSLAALGRSSRRLYHECMPFLWNHVQLVDRTHYHTDLAEKDPSSRRLSENDLYRDDHDDTPIINLLVTLVNNIWLASLVHNLEHRCHLPTPAIFDELPKTEFCSRSLSFNPRTLDLLGRACSNLTNVQTLRIIFGHFYLTRGLILGLFDSRRAFEKPLRKLWLENCSFFPESDEYLKGIVFEGLESVRFRRLRLLESAGHRVLRESYSRGLSARSRHNSTGDSYMTAIDDDRNLEYCANALIDTFWETNIPQYETIKRMMIELDVPQQFDDRIWANILETRPDVPPKVRDMRYDNVDRILYALNPFPSLTVGNRTKGAKRPFCRLRNPDWITTSKILDSAATTLTSINLDWILIGGSNRTVTQYYEQLSTLTHLLALRFPHLIAFQVRNAVLPETLLPPGIYLLDQCYDIFDPPQTEGADIDPDIGIAFMEAHSKLQCLAWPMDKFFHPSTSVSARSQAIIQRLSSTLKDLRIDYFFDEDGEPRTDRTDREAEDEARDSRRRFISDFASEMRTVESLKIEGGIPQDERWQLVRALNSCPLRKVVEIGVNWPAGNTWGASAQDLASMEGIGLANMIPDFATLEGDDPMIISRVALSDPLKPGSEWRFVPEYGQDVPGHVLHLIASHYASTITELKFSGYRGCPVLWTPLPITTYYLRPLRHFHNLEEFVISLWFQTLWEHQYRDKEIVDYWLNLRSSSSTALTAPNDPEPNGWARELATRYAPEKLAERIFDFVGPFLSETAKAKSQGINVRGSFCIGIHGGMFDLDVRIGKGPDGADKLLGWKGPREELHPERRAEKLRDRRWF